MALSDEALLRFINRVDQTEQKIKKVDQDVLGGNEGKRRANSSIIGGLFDLLSRPSRMSASAINALVDKDPETKFVQEAIEGLKGNRDTNFSDVLGNVGVENRYVKAGGGFLGDVLLDPLTYVGVKNVKGFSDAESRIRAVKELTKRSQEVTDDAVTQVSKELQRENPTHTYITFAGRKVTPSVTQPATVARGAKEAIIGPEDARRKGAQWFSRRSQEPFGLADMARVYESRSAGIFGRHQDQLRNFFGGLTDDEKTLISKAIEKGELLTAPASVKRPGFETLGDYQKLAQDQFKRWFDDEAALGLYKPEQYDPKYLYKYFRKGLPERLPGLPAGAVLRGNKNSLADFEATLKGAIAAGTPPEDIAHLLASKRKTLEEAQKAGLDPVTNIDEILEMRAAKHYRTVGRQAYVQDAIREFGVDMTPKNMGFLLGERNKFRQVGTSLAAPISQRDDLAKKWIPESIARAINGTETILKDGQVGADFVRFYDNVLGKWKGLNTSWNPGYHVRNGISDAIINYMDGVRNPTLYDRAARTIAGAKKANDGDLLGIGKIDEANARINLGKHNKLTTSEVWDLYLRGGSKSGYITAELQPNRSALNDEAIAKAAIRAKSAVQGKLQGASKKLTDWGDTREDFFRLAHHIKAMEDNLPKDRVATPEELTQASLKAGERVRKYNIDYGLLSSVEKNVMRRVIPFYGWTRRNLPLQVELLFTKPGFMAAYPKGQDLMQGMLGSDDGEGDFLIPKWIRDLAPVRIAQAKNEENQAAKVARFLAGAGSNEAVFMPLVSSMTPVGDIDTLLSPVAKAQETPGSLQEKGIAGVREGFHNLINMATPVAKIPYEVGTGRSTYTGQEIDNWGDWLASQAGPSRIGARAAQGQAHSVTSGLLGIGLQPVTAKRQHSEFKRREDVLDALTRQEKNRVAAKRGIENPSQRFLNRVTSPEIRRVRQWKEYNKRILGDLLPDEDI